jgi:DNA-binding MarR family transcriptional regulator
MSQTLLTPDRAVVDLGGLETQVGFVLRQAQLAVFQDLLAALRPFGLRVTEFSVLTVIGASPGLKQQAVGEALQIQRPNLIAILDRLQQRGLVRRDPVASDRRAYALALTSQGRALLGQACRAQADHERRLRGCLGGLDTTLVLEALVRIATL